MADDSIISYIPLTMELITNTHASDLYYYLNYIRLQGTRQFSSFTRDYSKVITYIDKSSNTCSGARKALGITRQTWAKYTDKYTKVEWIDADETSFVAMLPVAAFDMVMRFINTVTPMRRNLLTKVFCYIFIECNNHYSHNLQKPVETMARELSVDRASMAAAIKALDSEKLIIKYGGFSFGGEKSFSYHYKIPDEFFPPRFKREDNWDY